jgi:hypothetical protein
MGVAVTNVMKLAAAEAAAASRRSVAEAAWRSAWWDMTEALADMTDVEWRTRGAVLADVLGVSTSYLGSRRRASTFIAEESRDTDLLRRTPPRLAIEWTYRGKRRLDAAACEHLIAWEAGERSLRELANELGTAGRSWASKEELDRREAEAIGEATGATNGQASIAAIRAALADPDIAREVAAHGPSAAAIQTAHDQLARELTAHTRWQPTPTNVTTTNQIGMLTANLLRARELVVEVRRALPDLPLEDTLITGLMQAADQVVVEAALVRDALRDQARFAADLDDAALRGAR